MLTVLPEIINWPIRAHSHPDGVGCLQCGRCGVGLMDVPLVDSLNPTTPSAIIAAITAHRPECKRPAMVEQWDASLAYPGVDLTSPAQRWRDMR